MSPAATLSSAKFQVTPTDVQDVFILTPRVFGDARGWFMECYNKQSFAQIGIHAEFVQDNQSLSGQGVLRGLHYQVEQTQGKLVRTIAGEIYDVAVDLRKSSPTFGKWTAAILSAQNRRMMWIPEGCAHGFLVMTPTAEVAYKATDFYKPEAERTIRWDDPELNVQWPLNTAPTLSEKDQKGIPFANAPLFP
jgi:dTDP-4-dehydrorhamnose 3,5-epimerase